MTTFEEAREIVARRYGPGWPVGTFYVEPEGYEDAAAWWVVCGAREDLVEGRRGFGLWDQPAVLVSKGTGEVEELHQMHDRKRLDQMTPVGGQ